MRQWAKRPTEIAHLLNPAFCSILLHEAIVGYRRESEADMPYILLFLILPIVLHKPTRDLLPRSISTKLHAWIQENQSARIGFAERVRWTIPYTKEALCYAATADLISISDEGRMSLIKKRFKNVSWPKTSEPSLCVKKACFVGRWFSLAGGTSTILAMWGIRP